MLLFVSIVTAPGTIRSLFVAVQPHCVLQDNKDDSNYFIQFLAISLMLQLFLFNTVLSCNSCSSQNLTKKWSILTAAQLLSAPDDKTYNTLLTVWPTFTSYTRLVFCVCAALTGQTVNKAVSGFTFPASQGARRILFWLGAVEAHL